MRIGLILVAYRAEQYINSVLAPWVRLKCGLASDNGGLIEKPPEGLELVIVAVSAVFKGFGDDKAYDNEKTSIILNEYKNAGGIDEYIEIKDRQIWDFESRVAGWDYLKDKGCDLLWELDADEHYSSQSILKAIEWIKDNSMVDFYRIRFKNFFGSTRDRTYIEDFTPLRVGWVNRHGGIKQFYHDNDFFYEDGQRTPNVSNLIIPKGILFPDHYSWTYDEFDGPQRIIDKIEFQKRTLGTCSYKFENGKLSHDEKYYLTIGGIKPKIYYG